MRWTCATLVFALSSLAQEAVSANDSPGVVEIWEHQVVGRDAHPSRMTLYSNSRINDPNGRDTWSKRDNVLTLRWPNSKAPGGEWVDRCIVSRDGKSFSGRNQVGTRITGRLVLEAGRQKSETSKAGSTSKSQGSSAGSKTAGRGVNDKAGPSERSASARDPRSLRELALRHVRGDGVPKDISKAFELMNQAAKAGDGEAMYRLSLMYRRGRGVDRDVAMADQWLAKSRKTSFDPRSAGFADDAPSNMGPRGATRVDIESLERRAKAGDGQSMYELGVHLITGRDVPKDEKKGFSWLERAAKAGHADAMNDVGCCYFYGKCVSKDPSLAREWLTKAANAGSSRAQRAIAGARGGAGWKELSDVQKKQAIGLFLLALAATSGSSGESRSLACKGSGALFDCSCNGFVPGGLYDNPDPFTCRRCLHPIGDHSR